MLSLLFDGGSGILSMIGAVAAFAGVFWLLLTRRDMLPKDQGREYAVNGKQSAGKARGAGIIFVSIFVVASLIFGNIDAEDVIYLVLLVAEMISGYLDDAAAIPWGELKKGLIDLAIAVATTAVYIHYNGTAVTFALIGKTVNMPVVLFFILSILLIWTAINVVNCSDGVDGLSGSLSIVSLMGFYALNIALRNTDGNSQILFFCTCLLAYLWFNAAPSILMMGDAGSRAMGYFIALTALTSRSPFMFIPLALVLILDGGLGLVKVSLLRYAHVSIMEHVRTPLHDHVRKVLGWSNTHTVFRFVIIQIMICLIFVLPLFH